LNAGHSRSLCAVPCRRLQKRVHQKATVNRKQMWHVYRRHEFPGGGDTGRNIWDTSRYVLGNGIPIGIGIPCIGFRWEWDKNLASHGNGNGNRNRVDGNGNDPYSHGNVILMGNCKMQLTNKGRNRIGPLVHTEC